jgi:hypothetical protein
LVSSSRTILVAVLSNMDNGGKETLVGYEDAAAKANRLHPHLKHQQCSTHSRAERTQPSIVHARTVVVSSHSPRTPWCFAFDRLSTVYREAAPLPSYRYGTSAVEYGTGLDSRVVYLSSTWVVLSAGCARTVESSLNVPILIGHRVFMYPKWMHLVLESIPHL